MILDFWTQLVDYDAHYKKRCSKLNKPVDATNCTNLTSYSTEGERPQEFPFHSWHAQVRENHSSTCT